MEKQEPGVGIGVLIFRTLNDKVHILLGKRKGSHGAGLWALPGGKVGPEESLLECAEREVLEETGMEITRSYVSNIYHYHEFPNRNWATLYVIGMTDEEPKIMEPNKCEEWRWCDLFNLPEPQWPDLKDIVTKNYNTCCVDYKI